MTIRTINKFRFELRDDQDINAGCLRYENHYFERGWIEASCSCILQKTAAGIWDFFTEKESANEVLSKIRVKSDGKMTVFQMNSRRTYVFKKNTGWKTRFSLMNKKEEELLTLIPQVNWSKEAHDYILQLNDDFEEECDSFLILQAVHCANCSLGMMTGGTVPALVSI